MNIDLIARTVAPGGAWLRLDQGKWLRPRWVRVHLDHDYGRIRDPELGIERAASLINPELKIYAGLDNLTLRLENIGPFTLERRPLDVIRIRVADPR